MPIDGPPGGGGLSGSSNVMNADDELLFSEEDEDFMTGFMCRPGESGIYSPKSKVRGGGGMRENSRDAASLCTTVDLGGSLYRSHSRADSTAFYNKMKKQNQLFGAVGGGGGHRAQSGDLPRLKSMSRMGVGGTSCT